MINKSSFPAIMIALFIIGSFGIISLGYNLSSRPLVFLEYKNPDGLVWSDYVDFFRASENIIIGKSPYDIAGNRYVTTPIPAVVNILFVPLGFDTARVLFYLLIPLSLAVGYMLITSLFGFVETDKSLVLMAGLVGLLFGYPFYFLLQRENIDGWVFLFLCLGFYWLTKPQKESISGLFFSLAIAFKIYPILILVPILLGKKLRLLFWIGLWLTVWGGITLFWFLDFQNALTVRSQSFFRFDENGSLVATISLIFIFFDALGFTIPSLWIKYSPVIAALLYSLLFCAVAFIDYKMNKTDKYEIHSYMMYLPFMIALPQIVYHYSFINCLILIPAVCHLWNNTKNRAQKVTILIISIGIAITQWQAIATYHLTDNILSHAIPGVGLLVIISGIVLFKFLTFYEQFSRHEFCTLNSIVGLGKRLSR